MNQYGLKAKAHWEKHRPRELAAMENPERFFEAKGAEMQAAISTAEEVLEEATEPETDYQRRVGQLNQIRATAEQQVMAEHLPPPEDQEMEED